MSRTRFIAFEDRGFWAYDVAVGVFLKYLIDTARAAAQANEGWLSEAVELWRTQAVIAECGFNLDENWSVDQRKTVVSLVETACSALADRAFIPSEEIARWAFVGDMRIDSRGADRVLTAPIVGLGQAIIELINGKLEEAPRGEIWFYGTPEGRSTLRLPDV